MLWKMWSTKRAQFSSIYFSIFINLRQIQLPLKILITSGDIVSAEKQKSGCVNKTLCWTNKLLDSYTTFWNFIHSSRISIANFMVPLSRDFSKETPKWAQHTHLLSEETWDQDSFSDFLKVAPLIVVKLWSQGLLSPRPVPCLLVHIYILWSTCFRILWSGLTKT